MTDPTDRLPELGPELGSLIDLTRESGDPELGLEGIRLELVHRLFERAHAARVRLAAGDPAGAEAAFDRSAWLAAWDAAVAQVAERVTTVGRRRLERAAARSGYPPRRLRQALPGDDDRAALRAKLEAAGIPLEDGARRPSLGAGQWADSRRMAGAMEESWDRLENVVRLELAALAERVEAIDRWRPSPVPWIAAAVVVLGLSGWLGLALGGFLPRPGWLDGVYHWFWSLPWP